MKMAVLGLGNMGRAVAHRLLSDGHDLTVWNRTPGREKELIAAGATWAESVAAAVPSAEVVFTSLANDDAVQEVALGPEGIQRHLDEDAVYMDLSTVSPDVSERLEQEFDRFIAMPILGAPEAVRSGQAIYLVGGNPKFGEPLEPVLASLGGSTTHYDSPRLATTGKLAVNGLLLSGIVALAEAFAVGRSGGLTDDQLSDLLSSTPMLAPGLENRFEGVRQGGGAVQWTPVLAAKDSGLAIDVTDQADVKLRLAPVVRAAFESAVEMGLEDEDIVAVARIYS
ncbi:MAG TPA: NAD(P)-dependent oxidoreductase [Acidimicrobiales bacterium]|jgi:3-hydroxyisobutyrate dehydrogenase-like beta-hydroxyacid dehydrogenase